jgi:CheY-like chemotaxis protein
VEVAPRLLVVDDEPDVALLLEMALRRQGYDVTTAASGEEAIERAETDLPDCVLLDIMMPGIGGLEACRRLRESPRTRHMPVIMITGMSVLSPEKEVLATGADDWLPKPFDLTALGHMVNRVLAARR